MICSLGDKTCGACCWGSDVSRDELQGKLRRHRDLFSRHLSRPEVPGAVALLRHELLARRGLDLWLAVLLRLPMVGRRLRSWYRTRVVCAFLGFLDGSESRIGCLLHPRRWRGKESRQAAFRLLEGFRCGPPEYLCSAGSRFAASSPARKAGFEQRTRDLDWFDYSLAASTYASASREKQGDLPCPSSSTRP